MKSRRNVFFAGLVAVACLWSLFPIAWQVLTSFKDQAGVFAFPIRYWPEEFSLRNFRELFRARPFSRYLANSGVVATGATLVACVAGTLAAYVTTRVRPKWSFWVSPLVLAVAVFPPTVLLVPLYKTVQTLHLLNSRLGLILCYAALNLPLAYWLPANAFRRFPPSIEEAAQLDGLGPFDRFWRVILPLSAPAVASTALLVFIFSWNEFLLALTFVSGDVSRTAPVGIAMLSGVSAYEVPWNQITAGVVLTTLPVVAVVIFCQRRLLEGLTAGAVRG